MSEAQEFPQVKVDVDGTISPERTEVASGLQDLQQFLTSGGLPESLTPHMYQSDPYAQLPSNCESLVGRSNAIGVLLVEAEKLIEEELREALKEQKQIALWEEKVRKNHTLIAKNKEKIEQNAHDMLCDLKSRDFWNARAAQVLGDYGQAELSGTVSMWAWLIKKYGLKNGEGFLIDVRGSEVAQLCHKAASTLAAEYQVAATRYEHIHHQKEIENAILQSDYNKFIAINEQLQKYIANVYTSEVEPLQDGVLLLKELAIKLKTLEKKQPGATYGDLRSWAETFLDQFLRANSLVPHRVVLAFRRLASIPLPAENS
jgi:hypothetical protein